MKRLILGLVLCLRPAGGQTSDDLKNEVAALRALVQQLQARVDRLEGRPATAAAPPAASLVPQAPHTAAATPAPASNLQAGTSVNLLIDAYYGYNFNHPIGRANLLRAYDVSSNAFSLNQATLVVENTPDPANGKRWGARADFQFGQ